MKLYPYQEIGAQFLAQRRRALLADYMGLGKTAQVVRAIDHLNIEDVLVLCPAATRAAWARAVEQWSPFNHRVVLIARGTDSVPGRGILVCSYGLAVTPKIRRQILQRRTQVLVLDESHYLKTRTAKRTRLVYGHRCDGERSLIATAEYVWCLTGTPAPNNPSELWPMLHAFGVYRKSYWDFVYTFCTGHETPYGYKITGVANVDRLKAMLARGMLRRTWADVDQEMPPLICQEYPVEASSVPCDFLPLTFDVADANEALSRALDENPDSLESLGTPYATLRRYLGLSKVAATAQLARQILVDVKKEKIVIFAVHRQAIQCLAQALATFQPAIYVGGLTEHQRGKVLNEFLNNPVCRVFIGQIQAAGTGLDQLQHAARTVLIMEPSWCPSENTQAIGRLHRTGQPRPVRAFFISAAGTVDDEITASLKRKTEIITKII